MPKERVGRGERKTEVGEKERVGPGEKERVEREEKKDIWSWE